MYRLIFCYLLSILAYRLIFLASLREFFFEEFVDIDWFYVWFGIDLSNCVVSNILVQSSSSCILVTGNPKLQRNAVSQWHLLEQHSARVFDTTHPTKSGQTFDSEFRFLASQAANSAAESRGKAAGQSHQGPPAMYLVLLDQAATLSTLSLLQEPAHWGG